MIPRVGILSDISSARGKREPCTKYPWRAPSTGHMQNVELMQIEAVGAFARRCHDAMTRSRSWTVTVACAEIKLSSNRPAYCHGPLVDINTDSCERSQNLESVDKRNYHCHTEAAEPPGRVLRSPPWDAGTGFGLDFRAEAPLRLPEEDDRPLSRPRHSSS